MERVAGHSVTLRLFCSGETLQLTGVIRVAGEGKADGVVGGVENAEAHEDCDGTGVSLLRNLMEI